MEQDSQSRPLERRVFREEIREQLIEDILNGKLAPGARILRRDLPDLAATKRRAHDEAEQLQVAQRLAHRALTHTELLGNARFDELEALRARDPDRAEAAVRRHIEEPGEWIRSAHTPPDAQVESESGEQAAV